MGQVSVGKAQWDEALQIAEMVNRPYERLRHRNSRSPFLHRPLASAPPGPTAALRGLNTPVGWGMGESVRDDVGEAP